jgi:hypothetical protein
MIHQFASRLLKAVLVCLATVAVYGRLAAADELDEEAQRKQQLENLKRSAAQHTLETADTGKRAFKFLETPTLRFSNPVSGTKDGALYVWTDHGRPQAIVKLYTFNNKTYSHAWLSLSENSFSAVRDGKVIWSPTEPGIKWGEIPGAPRPAKTTGERLRQMKMLSAEFSAAYTALNAEGTFDLRILTQPLLRYETDDDYHADGALFGYVQSTAPVGLILLESRLTQDGPRWHYAFASLVTGQVTARYTNKEVFSLDRGNPGRDPRQPYLLLHSLPIPKE